MRKGTKTLIALGVLLAAVQVHGVQAQATYAEHSLLAEGRWYKIPVSETGVYKITADDIAGLSGTECSHIALYGADAGMLTSSNNQPRPDDLKPVALEMVDANGNGIFDEGDCLMFYGEGANVWRYNNPEQAFQFNMHAYANYNYYYLTPDHTPAAADADTLRIRPAVLPDNMRPDINTTTATALYHEDRINSHGGGQIWAADKFTPSLTTRTYKLQLPGSPSYGTVSARYAFANVSDYAAEIEVTIGDTKYRHTYTAGNYYYVFSNTFNTRQQEVEVTVRYIPHDNNATGYLDFIELNTFVPLTYSGSQLTVRNQQQILSGCKSRFVVRGNGNGLRAWDITSPDQPRSLAVSVPAEGSIAFEGATDKARSFVLFGTNDLLSPTGIVALENQDIHGSDVPDMVIVTHKNYKGQGERIGDLHLLHDGMNTLVVTQEEVFNEFSGGRPDPMAIRQMMRCLRHKAGNGTNDAPRYLLLLGKGTYDNRDLLGNGLSTVITYETPASFNSEGNVFPSDDVYGYLDDATSGVFEGSMSVGIGRLPAKSNAEADHMIDKIEGYLTRRDLESDQVRGDWRNYVALLADDADPSSPGDTNFASDSEITARQIKELYPHYNIDRREQRTAATDELRMPAAELYRARVGQLYRHRAIYGISGHRAIYQYRPAHLFRYQHLHLRQIRPDRRPVRFGSLHAGPCGGHRGGGGGQTHTPCAAVQHTALPLCAGRKQQHRRRIADGQERQPGVALHNPDGRPGDTPFGATQPGGGDPHKPTACEPRGDRLGGGAVARDGGRRDTRQRRGTAGGI